MRCERDSSPKNEKSVITDLPKCHFKTSVTLFLSRMQKEMFNRMFMLVDESICIVSKERERERERRERRDERERERERERESERA